LREVFAFFVELLYSVISLVDDPQVAFRVDSDIAGMFELAVASSSIPKVLE
jgi:hypothetical protein